MHYAVTYPPINSAEPENVPPVFNVLILYEDFETGKHAKKTYDILVKNLGQDCHFTNQMWKFDVLAVPKLREFAVKDAIKADIILVSSHGTSVPPEVEAWGEAWQACNSTPLALVALFDQPESDLGNPMRDYLAELARRAKVDFFAQPDQWPERSRWEKRTSAMAEGLEDRTLSTLAGAVQNNLLVSHWGINE